MTKLISWNVNGLRAALGKGFADSISALDPDVLCLQETKLSVDTEHPDLPGYEAYYLDAQKKGYSGTAVFSRIPVKSVTYGIGIPEHDTDGRAITLEYENFYLLCVYTPNAQRELARLDYRMSWEDALRGYILALDAKKPVIYCGDLNVAHCEIDLKNPSSNHKNAGFSDEERAKFGELLASGFTDTFRALYPDTVKYSWWSYMFNARANNAGWRIDYFIVSDRLFPRVRDSFILHEVMGSDHCPVGIEIDL